MSAAHLLSSYAHLDSPVHRAPAGAKLAVSVGLVVAIMAVPRDVAVWTLALLPVLLAVARAARVPLRAVIAGLAMALPFLAGVAALALFQRRGLDLFVALLARSMVAVLTVQLLANTTPVSDLLRAMKRAHVPSALLTTVALLHRYLFLIADESQRMRRAKRGRTLRTRRFELWRSLGTTLGLLFVRTVSRAERVHAAMRARGWS
jgi:cobalt ECF transporter T component CbiQ